MSQPSKPAGLFPDMSDMSDAPAQAGRTPFDPLALECPPTKNGATALVAMIGEAPSTHELRDRQPFVGPAGQLLNRACAAANLPRHQIYLTNACKAKLPGNKSSTLWDARGWRHASWGELQSRLVNELAETAPRLIIPLGATALAMLLDDPSMTAISKYAGSIYPTSAFPHLASLGERWIMPTFHPASALPRATPTNLYTIIANLRKGLAVLDDPTLMEQRVELVTAPGYDDTIACLRRAGSEATLLSVDIEATPAFVTCIGLAWTSPSGDIVAISIPLMNNKGNYWGEEEEIDIIAAIGRLLARHDLPKVAQNGMFDFMYLLRTLGVHTNNFYFDTMIAQHIAYTDLPKGLDYLTAAYTYFPYYKDEGKQSHLAHIKDWPSYWEYNAKDAAYLLPITQRLLDELADVHALDAMTYSMNLHKPLMEMEARGILTDRPGIASARATYSTELREMTEELHTLAGHALNYNSPKQLVAYFYGTLGMRPYVNRKSGRPTCDAVALSRIARKQVKGSREAELIIKVRKHHKMLSTYFDIPVDEDDRLRCQHKIAGTVSGRIATASTFFGTGANLQNQPYAFKHYLIPDPGYILVEMDLAKAEAHVVAFLCQDEAMIDAFESGIDVHTFNASKIFSVPMEAVTKEQRTMGKRVVHASNYKMGPQTFSDNLAKDFVYYSQSKCRDLLNAYSARFPSLARWHREIEKQVATTRMLYNLFGRPKRFLGLINDALFRNAISYIPQSTVAELLNRGTIAVANDERLMPGTPMGIELLTTVHDSIVFQMPIDQARDHLATVLGIVDEHMHHVFTVRGRSFSIGLDAKIGTAWAGKTIEPTDFQPATVRDALDKLGA